jgi:hypothetical protein
MGFFSSFAGSGARAEVPKKFLKKDIANQESKRRNKIEIDIGVSTLYFGAVDNNHVTWSTLALLYSYLAIDRNTVLTTPTAPPGTASTVTVLSHPNR